MEHALCHNREMPFKLHTRTAFCKTLFLLLLLLYALETLEIPAGFFPAWKHFNQEIYDRFWAWFPRM